MMFQVTCVLCDGPVLVEKEDWDSKVRPVATCDPCLEKRPSLDLIRLIYGIKCQLASVYHELMTFKNEVTVDIRKLYSAQQDIEQSFLLEPENPHG